jgi:hypothetical protein
MHHRPSLACLYPFQWNLDRLLRLPSNKPVALALKYLKHDVLLRTKCCSVLWCTYVAVPHLAYPVRHYARTWSAWTNIPRYCSLRSDLVCGAGLS